MSDSLLSRDLEIDRVVYQFELALRRGESVRIEDLVDRNGALGEKLIHELLRAEIEFRHSQQLSIDWTDLAVRFPEVVPEMKREAARPEVAVDDTSRTSLLDSVANADSPAAPQESDDWSLAPLQLSDYELQKKLGGGGQGSVFLAMQRSLGRLVAIKLLNQLGSRDKQSEQRFLREAKTLAQTSHPQIVTIHGIGRTSNRALFLVMEFIAGPDLAKQMAAKPFDVRAAVTIALRIAQAVEHAHSRGVIHRDLKPSNILWHEVRGPVVTDFGLAKDLRTEDSLTLTEQMVGTPTYMAPEQAHRRFGEISEQTDVYGLAATLYALLTGQPPIPPGSIAEVLENLTSDLPVTDPRHWRSELPATLCVICSRGLAKYPHERYSSIRDLIIDLQRWLSDEGAEDSLPPTGGFLREPRRTLRLEPGQQLGRYKLLAACSRDPTRRVFCAEDESGRPILLKCLPSDWLADRQKRSHFRQEVLLSYSLSHPCLSKVVEAGTIADVEFLALEYLEGESLSQRLAREGKFTERRSGEILVPIAEALHLIHGAGVIYRDLRPQNILLTRDDQPMLAEVRFSEELSPKDNLTMFGHGRITSKYVAPELFLGKPSDVASDVYTLGAVLYTLVTGEEPFSQEHDSIKLLIAKNGAQFTPPNYLVPDLSQPLCDLIAESLRANPAQRPASAKEFADRLSACVRKDRTEPASPVATDPDNLLHTVWDQLDPELQDAFSLAFNKKRRTGSSRISTRDLFEAMVRLGGGPLRTVFNELPPGALPDPADAGIPVDRTVLQAQPMLSDCVRESLSEFRKIGSEKVRPVDLFVDVAKYGHGPSVVRLREHGIDPAAMERIVSKLGLRVIRREANSANKQMDEPGNHIGDENVQFSVYRPRTIPPESWQPLLAFAHLSELPPDAPPGAPDPVAEVQRQAKQVLAATFREYQPTVSDSTQPIPREGEITFVPTGEGLEFNPRQRTFQWREPVHREEFRFKAAAHLDGQIARGRLSVYLGRLLIAEVSLVTRVDRHQSRTSESMLTEESRANRFRRIFACVSHADRTIVAEFQQYAHWLRDTLMMAPFVDRNQPPRDTEQLIHSADVFQLYWSKNALQSPYMERQWRYALSLRRNDFIRSLYWEEPFPTDPSRNLPPPELLALGFQKIVVPWGAVAFKRGSPDSVQTELLASTESQSVFEYSGERTQEITRSAPAKSLAPPQSTFSRHSTEESRSIPPTRRRWSSSLVAGIVWGGVLIALVVLWWFLW